MPVDKDHTKKSILSYSLHAYLMSYVLIQFDCHPVLIQATGVIAPVRPTSYSNLMLTQEVIPCFL